MYVCYTSIAHLVIQRVVEKLILVDLVHSALGLEFASFVSPLNMGHVSWESYGCQASQLPSKGLPYRSVCPMVVL